MASCVPALVVVLVAVAVAGCGEDDASSSAVTGAGGAASSSGDAGAGGAPESGARLPCAPGELAHDDGSCEPPGVPADACGTGFAPVDDAGCEPILPSSPCGPGQMAALGETTCRDVAPCSGAWGEAPIDADTQHVDAAFADPDSDGTAAKPWTTIGAAVQAAAPGAVVAIAAGIYQEAVVLSKPVRLWGACPGDVSIEAVTGAASITIAAAGAEVHDLAVTGAGVGVDVVGASDVVLDRLWIHDAAWSGVSARAIAARPGVSLRRSLVERATVAGVISSGAAIIIEDSVVRESQPLADGTFGRGVSIEPDAATGVGSAAHLRRSVVELTHEVGVLTLGSQLTVEDTLVRSTQPRVSDDGVGAGIEAFPDVASGNRSSAVVIRSVVADNRYCGICATDSELSVEHTVVRDTLPEAASEGFGFGVRLLGADEAQPERPVGSLRGSLVERSHLIGVAVVGAEATIETTMVRDTEPRASDQAFGRGISVELSYESARPSKAVLSGIRVERSHELGVMIVGSEADVDCVHVRDTRSRASDGAFGVGLGFVTDVFTSASASGTLRRSVIEQSHVAGLLVAGAQVSASDVAVRDTATQESGDFGDGVIATSFLVLIPGIFPTTLDLAHATVERSARAGLATFGAEVSLAATVLECNDIALDGEIVEGEGFSLEDQGGNVCGCSGETEICRVLSSNLEPPAAVSL